MPYFLNMCSLWSITSTNWLCRNIEMFSPSACILLYVCHFCLTCSHTVVHPHTHPQTLSLSLSWQCSEQSLSVLLTVIFPDECLFVSCVSPHTHPANRGLKLMHLLTHIQSSIHPSTLLCILPPTCPSTLPNLLSTLLTLYTLFCVAVQCKSHLWSFAATFQTKIKTCMNTTSTTSTLQGLDWF